jgi:hypothetical protein
MSRCREGAGRRAPGVLLAVLALLTPAVTGARDGPPEAAPPEATAPEAAPEPAPEPAPRPFTARMVVTEVGDGTRTGRSFAFRKLGPAVRIEADASADPRFTPETFYDYGKGEYYRMLADDDIAFAYLISDRERFMARIEGIADLPREEPVYRLEVNRDVAFEGHPCTLVLTGFRSPAGRIHALRWVWEARDLGGQAVKVVYPRADGSILIVEQRDASGAPFDPALVRVPAGRAVLSGF